jgi:hypothetical protein
MIQSAYHKKAKRGISTVLGLLLMVGVIFTTVIPLFIYVNSVDNYYDTTVVNMGIADQERSKEELDVYATGHNETSESIDVTIINKSPLTINITRVWIIRRDLQKIMIFTSKNESSLPLQIIASAQMSIDDLDFSTMFEDPELDYFNIEVTTARGNVFSSKTNPLHRNGGGGWTVGENPPWIEVLVRSEWNFDSYKVEIFNTLNLSQEHQIREIDHIHGDYFVIVPVFIAGTYNITVTNTHHDYKVGSVLRTVEESIFGSVALAWFNDINE